MLAVILKILSVIGIVLLCLLGLVLVLALLILILPVRYRIRASKEKEAELNAFFKLTYFFHIIRALAVYEKKKCIVTVKVLWFKLFSLEFPEESDDTGAEFSDEEFDSFLEEELPDDEPAMAADSEQWTGREASGDEGEQSGQVEAGVSESGVSDEELHNDLFGDDYESGDSSQDAYPGNETEGPADPDDAGFNPEDSAEDEDSEGFTDRISGLISKIKCKFGSIYDKIIKVRSELRYYRNILNSNEAAYALRVIRKRLRKVLKLILPRKVSCDLVYGFSSPDITGKVYGLYCLIRKRFTKGSRVVPDFENAVFEGYIDAKGHFNLISLLYNAVCIILDKNCRKIYRSLKHHRNNESGSADEAENAASEEAA